MLDFLRAISDFAGAVCSFLINIVSGLAFLLSMIPKAFVLLTYCYGFMPAALLAFCMAGISICIVFHIIGR